MQVLDSAPTGQLLGLIGRDELPLIRFFFCGGLEACPKTSPRALQRSWAPQLSARHTCNSFEATTAALAAKTECDTPPTWNARRFLGS